MVVVVFALMADELGGSAQSLAGLAVERGLITPAERDKMLAELRRRAQAGAPISFARLLVGASIPAPTVQSLLATGASYPAVLCEGCGQAIPQGMLPERREYPCSRCGNMVLGFATFLRAPPPRDAEDEANTEEVAALPARPPAAKPPAAKPPAAPAPPAPAPPPSGVKAPRTPTPRSVVRLRPPPSLTPPSDEAAPLPARPAGVTDRYDEVLPVPAPAPLVPAGEAEGEDVGGRTMTFDQVLRPAPPPGGAPPVAPPATPAASSAGDGEELGGTTLQFDNVFVLPNRRSLSESQVQDQMVTLLGPASAYGLGLDAPPAGPGAPGFDPNGMTVPTGIPALGPAPPAAPKGPIPGADGERTMLVDMSASVEAGAARRTNALPAPQVDAPPPVVTGPPAPASPPALDATMVVPPGGGVDPTIIAPPPGVEDTRDMGECKTLSPTYHADTPTLPPDQVYAVQGPRMQQAARRRPRGPRVWPWVLALFLLLGTAAAGLYLLLTTSR